MNSDQIVSKKVAFLMVAVLSAALCVIGIVTSLRELVWMGGIITASTFIWILFGVFPTLEAVATHGRGMERIVHGMLKSLHEEREEATEQKLFKCIVVAVRRCPEDFKGAFKGIPQPVLARLCMYCVRQNALERSQFQAMHATPDQYRLHARDIEQLRALEEVIRGGQGDLSLCTAFENCHEA